MTRLPTWSTQDVHDSFTTRSFVDAMERTASDIDRLVALFDQHGMRAVPARVATAADANIAAQVTDTRNEQTQALLSELETCDARFRPPRARLADWVSALGAESLAELHPLVADHVRPLPRLAERAENQMSEAEEHLYAEMAVTGSSAWSRLQRAVTSQLTIEVDLPEGVTTLPLTAARGLATHPDSFVRRAAYDAEMWAWPRIATTSAAAMNAIKGEANAGCTVTKADCPGGTCSPHCTTWHRVERRRRPTCAPRRRPTGFDPGGRRHPRACCSRPRSSPAGSGERSAQAS